MAVTYSTYCHPATDADYQNTGNEYPQDKLIDKTNVKAELRLNKLKSEFTEFCLYCCMPVG